LRSELLRTRELKSRLDAKDDLVYDTLSTSVDKLVDLVNEMDNHPELLGYLPKHADHPTFTRLEKTSFSIDELVTKIFRDRFAVEGVGFSNVHEVFDPRRSGIGSISTMKEHLEDRGMSHALIETLEKRYLQAMRSSKYSCSIMDLFSDKKAKKALKNVE